MSLLNQMLNDLEKRGANGPLADMRNEHVPARLLCEFDERHVSLRAGRSLS